VQAVSAALTPFNVAAGTLLRAASVLRWYDYAVSAALVHVVAGASWA
jgi:hypothetical protein